MTVAGRRLPGTTSSRKGDVMSSDIGWGFADIGWGVVDLGWGATEPTQD